MSASAVTTNSEANLKANTPAPSQEQQALLNYRRACYRIVRALLEMTHSEHSIVKYWLDHSSAEFTGQNPVDLLMPIPVDPLNLNAGFKVLSKFLSSVPQLQLVFNQPAQIGTNYYKAGFHYRLDSHGIINFTELLPEIKRELGIVDEAEEPAAEQVGHVEVQVPAVAEQAPEAKQEAEPDKPSKSEAEPKAE